MNLTTFINRKMVFAVLAPIFRAILTAFVGYMVAHGAPADMVDQLAAGLASISIIAFNIGWELLDRKKASNKAAALASIAISDAFKERGA